MPKLLSAVLQPVARYFVAGLLAILPLVLTVAIVVWVAGFVQRFIGPQTFLGDRLQELGLRFSAHRTFAYVIGWLFVLGTVFVVGFLVEMGAKQFLQRLQDGMIRRIPLVGSIYGTSKQLVGMFDRKSEADMKAMSVVFCVFGQEAGAGVLALMPSRERYRIDGKEYQVVIIPTAPVPFGGGLLFMPVECVRPAGISVEALMSIYVSMGVTTPQFLREIRGTK